MQRTWLRAVALLTVALIGLHGCATPTAPGSSAGQASTVTLVHLNDVYEILPVEGGSGSEARSCSVLAASPMLSRDGAERSQA